MSKGLGKTQRAILKLLEDAGGSQSLSCLGFDLWYNDKENFKNSDTAYICASRACGGLEKKGLVTKRRRDYEGQAEPTRCSSFISNTEITLVKC